jgi:hypothetical protein
MSTSDLTAVLKALVSLFSNPPMTLVTQSSNSMAMIGRDAPLKSVRIVSPILVQDLVAEVVLEEAVVDLEVALVVEVDLEAVADSEAHSAEVVVVMELALQVVVVVVEDLKLALQ